MATESTHVHFENSDHHESARSSGHESVGQYLKTHRNEVIIGGAIAVGVAFLFYRMSTGGASGGSAPVSGNGGAGLNEQPTSTGVSTDMLQSAMQTLSQQEQSDIAGLTQQLGQLQPGVSSSDLQTALASLSQSEAQNLQSLEARFTALLNQTNPYGGNTGSSGASGGGGGYTNPSGTGSTGGTSPVQTVSNFFKNALSARNSIGDAQIVSFFNQFKLPSWIGLQYVAQNYSTMQPGHWQPSLTQLQNWLNQQGYRDPSTGAFTAVVSSGTVPSNVQSILNQAYG